MMQCVKLRDLIFPWDENLFTKRNPSIGQTDYNATSHFGDKSLIFDMLIHICLQWRL